MIPVAAPSKREVLFLINSNPAFVERMLLCLYRSHMSTRDKSIQANVGKGFSYATQKVGISMGRWLDTKGSFTSGNGTRGKKTREQHIEAARQVLATHLDQVVLLCSDVVVGAQAVNQQQAAAKAQLQQEVNLQRSREIMNLLGEMSDSHPAPVPASPEEEEEAPPTVRDIRPSAPQVFSQSRGRAQERRELINPVTGEVRRVLEIHF